MIHMLRNILELTPTKRTTHKVLDFLRSRLIRSRGLFLLRRLEELHRLGDLLRRRRLSPGDFDSVRKRRLGNGRRVSRALVFLALLRRRRRRRRRGLVATGGRVFVGFRGGLRRALRRSFFGGGGVLHGGSGAFGV